MALGRHACYHLVIAKQVSDAMTVETVLDHGMSLPHRIPTADLTMQQRCMEPQQCSLMPL